MLPAVIRSLRGCASASVPRPLYLLRASSTLTATSQQLLQIDADHGGPSYDMVDMFETSPDDALELPDHTAQGHALLDAIRSVRHYLRKEKYEVPKLAQFQKPYIPPAPDAVVRVRTLEYLGEESHPAAKKCVVSARVKDLGLSPEQSHTFKLISGPRYNPRDDTIIISAERYPTLAENRAWAINTLGRAIEEAKNPRDGDTFADIPLTFPHDVARERKKRVALRGARMPEAWKWSQKEVTAAVDAGLFCGTNMEVVASASRPTDALP